MQTCSLVKILHTVLYSALEYVQGKYKWLSLSLLLFHGEINKKIRNINLHCTCRTISSRILREIEP